jgi:hypothetical protein
MRGLSFGRAVLLAIGYVFAFLALTVLYVVAWLAWTQGWHGDWKFFWLVPDDVVRNYLALMLVPPGLFLLAWVAARVRR